MSNTPSPGSGFRHQHLGGPAACGQYSTLIGKPTNAVIRANTASTSAAVRVPLAISGCHERPRMRCPSSRSRRSTAANASSISTSSGSTGVRCPACFSGAHRHTRRRRRDGVRRRRSPGKRAHLDLREALALVGRFELALIAKLHGRQKGGDILLSQRGQFRPPEAVRIGSPAVTRRSPALRPPTSTARRT